MAVRPNEGSRHADKIQFKMRRQPVLKQTASGEIYTDESTMQRACVRWFRIKFDPMGFSLFSIPNGGKLGGRTSKKGFSIQAAIMVGEGMTAGVADLFLSLPRCGLHGLYIEMKTPVGVWEKTQQQFAIRQIDNGYGYVLCRSQNYFEKVVQDYLSGQYVQLPFDEIESNKPKGRRRISQSVVAV